MKNTLGKRAWELLLAWALLTGCGWGSKKTQAIIEDTNTTVVSTVEQQTETTQLETPETNNQMTANFNFLDVTDNSFRVIINWLDQDGLQGWVVIEIRNADWQYIHEETLPLKVNWETFRFDKTFTDLYADRQYTIAVVTTDLKWNKEACYGHVHTLKWEEPTPENHAPTINSISWDRTITEGDTLTLTAHASDSDWDSLTYTWTADSWEISVWQTSSIDGLTVWTHTITLEVEDENGAVATETVIVTVEAVNVNNAPTLNLQLTGVSNIWGDNYEWDTDDTVVFDMSWSIDSDWSIVNYSVKDITNNTTLYDWASSSYSYDPTGLFWQNISYKIEITDNDWAKTSKTVNIDWVF